MHDFHAMPASVSRSELINSPGNWSIKTSREGCRPGSQVAGWSPLVQSYHSQVIQWVAQFILGGKERVYPQQFTDVGGGNMGANSF